MGLMGLVRASYGGLWGILSGLTKSADHPSRDHKSLGKELVHPVLAAGCLLWHLLHGPDPWPGVPAVGACEVGRHEPHSPQGSKYAKNAYFGA